MQQGHCDKDLKDSSLQILKILVGQSGVCKIDSKYCYLSHTMQQIYNLNCVETMRVSCTGHVELNTRQNFLFCLCYSPVRCL